MGTAVGAAADFGSDGAAAGSVAASVATIGRSACRPICGARVGFVETASSSEPGDCAFERFLNRRPVIVSVADIKCFFLNSQNK